MKTREQFLTKRLAECGEEVERLRSELADTLLGPTMVQNQRTEIERLRAALEEIVKEVGTSTRAAKIARDALAAA